MEILTNGKLQKAEMKTEPKSKAGDPRAAQVEYFVTILTEQRDKDNFERFRRASAKGMSSEQFRKAKLPPWDRYLEPITVERIAVMLSHIKTDDLYPFFQRCMRYEKEGKGPFSKAFFGSLKIKTDAKSK